MAQYEGKKSLANKAKWPLFLMANVAVLLVVGMSTVRETYKGWTVDHEIKALEMKAQALEGRKMQLSELASKMQESDYAEREARAKLNMQKPGEKVVILEGVAATQTTWQIDVVTAPPPPVVNLSNPERWWQYFVQGGRDG
ncbi:MAG TPA: septum formation initiator family protein [bacterium]|nr:MAG: Cell division protein FtsL [Parcubacteria group bacterium ADurb.Bin192]HPN15228.1 septum formation initiator family protein [bacterium]